MVGPKQTTVPGVALQLGPAPDPAEGSAEDAAESGAGHAIDSMSDSCFAESLCSTCSGRRALLTLPEFPLLDSAGELAGLLSGGGTITNLPDRPRPTRKPSVEASIRLGGDGRVVEGWPTRPPCPASGFKWI